MGPNCRELEKSAALVAGTKPSPELTSQIDALRSLVVEALYVTTGTFPQLAASCGTL